MSLFRALEEHIFTQTFGAFHHNSVITFAVNADPCSAGIASPAEQQTSEPWQSAAVHIRNLRGLVLLTLARNSRKGKWIPVTDQTLFAPFIKKPLFALWNKAGKK